MMKIGLLILDWDMPEINGLKFLKKTRLGKKTKKQVFYNIESRNDKERVLETIKVRVIVYMVKPINWKTFVPIIDKIFGTK